MDIPTDYDHPGCTQARALNGEMTDNYLAHTWIGDPLADAAMVALSKMKRRDSTQLIRDFIDDTVPETLTDAPPELHAFFADASTPPDWFDGPALGAGVNMFLRNLKMVLGGMIAGTLVEGFSTNISQSFFITGRLRDQGVRRLQQNNRHMLEIFFPGGLERQGDGWKLSVRIRLIHAQIRGLLADSQEWNHDAWGTPLSSAHLGYAITAFSARLLKHMKRMGASYTPEEAASFMAAWRYSGYLMGIPESILFRDEEDALKLFEIGALCEPVPGTSSAVMAHSLVNSAPLVVGIADREEQLQTSRYVYKMSRALIGDPLADQLNYPKQSSFGALPWFRAQARYDAVMSKFFPKHAGRNQFDNFMTLLSGSRYDDVGISYEVPDHVYAEESSDF